MFGICEMLQIMSPHWEIKGVGIISLPEYLGVQPPPP